MPLPTCRLIHSLLNTCLFPTRSWLQIFFAFLVIVLWMALDLWVKIDFEDLESSHSCLCVPIFLSIGHEYFAQIVALIRWCFIVANETKSFFVQRSFKGSAELALLEGYFKKSPISYAGYVDFLIEVQTALTIIVWLGSLSASSSCSF